MINQKSLIKITAIVFFSAIILISIWYFLFKTSVAKLPEISQIPLNSYNKVYLDDSGKVQFYNGLGFYSYDPADRKITEKRLTYDLPKIRKMWWENNDTVFLVFKNEIEATKLTSDYKKYGIELGADITTYLWKFDTKNNKLSLVSKDFAISNEVFPHNGSLFVTHNYSSPDGGNIIQLRRYDNGNYTKYHQYEIKEKFSLVKSFHNCLNTVCFVAQRQVSNNDFLFSINENEITQIYGAPTFTLIDNNLAVFGKEPNVITKKKAFESEVYIDGSSKDLFLYSLKEKEETKLNVKSDSTSTPILYRNPEGSFVVHQDSGTLLFNSKSTAGQYISKEFPQNVFTKNNEQVLSHQQKGDVALVQGLQGYYLISTTKDILPVVKDTDEISKDFLACSEGLYASKIDTATKKMHPSFFYSSIDSEAKNLSKCLQEHPNDFMKHFYEIHAVSNQGRGIR